MGSGSRDDAALHVGTRRELRFLNLPSAGKAVNTEWIYYLDPSAAFGSSVGREGRGIESDWLCLLSSCAMWWCGEVRVH